jgi:alkyl sulfatase BDS1-like metallo-beta-lactamase superfamily hydrolase
MQVRNALTRLSLFGIVSAGLAGPALAQDQDLRNDATDATRSANERLLDVLPFDETADFDNARRGFIASLPTAMIEDEQGNPVWDPELYGFITEDADTPDTVNPSLWRQSQLINIDGLFQVTDGIYQVRNLDLSNMTIIEGDEGITIVDPLISAETARVGLDLYFEHRGERPVEAVIYTHSHVDHYGGVRGVVDEADVEAGDVRIFAPDGFLEAAVAENVMSGNAMSRRATYMYGNLLPADPRGKVGAGLGTTSSTGTVTLIPPTDLITETGQRETIDGLTYEFLMAPHAEAPAGMMWYIEEKQAIAAGEIANHTLHNTYSLRGAKIREPLPWSKYLNQAVMMWGDEAEVVFGQHHWPTWGNENVVEFLQKQRDLYRFINDETLRKANHGMTMREIAETFELPDSLGHYWSNRGYYGSIYHNVAATYVLYLGWFDGNPATLHELPPVEASEKYVDFMGGADAVLERARESFDAGEYRWVAQVVNHVVFAEPDNQDARNLQADALEQLGYQAESGPWRNFYLTGAKELREGVTPLAAASTASPDTIRAMTLEMFFDYLAVRLNSEEAADAEIALNFSFEDEDGDYLLELANGVLNNTAGRHADDADASVALARTTLDDIILGQTTLEQAIMDGDVEVDGDAEKLGELVALLDTFDLWFDIVTP